MASEDGQPWEHRVVSPERVLERLRPGMSIFLGTGAAEPRTLVRQLMASEAANLQDLELIQLVSFGEALSLKALQTQKYRLKTFFSGWVAEEAITAGRVDLIPSRFAWIPRLIESGAIPVGAAFVQVTPPNEAGYCSLGVAVDVARQAMDRAVLKVGEINRRIPRTFGDTFVKVTDFDLLVESEEPPIYFSRWTVDDVFDQVAENVASLIQDGSCIAFSIGPLYDALGRHLARKRHLGVHSPFFTDALMDLVVCGAVTNRLKETYRGKSLVSYALGTAELLAWLDQNPIVDFHRIDKLFNPLQIGRNPGFVAVFPARKIDLTGNIVLHRGKQSVASGPAEIEDLIAGAEISPGGMTIFALPSRNRVGKPNILLSVSGFPNLFTLRERVALVVTEYGVVNLRGLTLRERAQALIDIAHPGDRSDLVVKAKSARILYADQIYLPESGPLYPIQIDETHTFRDGLKVRFRAIRPSDEEAMRRLFYRFSDEAIYYRYFSKIRTMSHDKMQEYVNVNWRHAMAIVGLIGQRGRETLIAEGRFIREPHRPSAEVNFIVDEKYQRFGIATYLFRLLISLARPLGIQEFTADVLFSNTAMMKVFKNGGLPITAKLDQGEYHLTIPLDIASPRPDPGPDWRLS
jgi:acyl-CoA hydrolase/GNAT superfamily N-acetyltransferase